jgi:hypothetical protein
MTQSTSTQNVVPSSLDAQVHREDASNVQGWEPGLKPSRMRGYSLSDGRRHTRAMLSARLRSVNRKLNLPAWHKPYAEALLESDPEISAPLLAATERAIFERLLELSAAADASDETRDMRRAIDVVLDLKAKALANSKILTGLPTAADALQQNQS